MQNHLFFTAFGDEFNKVGGITPLVHAGLGAAALYGAQKAHKDWESGRKQRLRREAMKKIQDVEPDNGREY